MTVEENLHEQHLNSFEVVCFAHLGNTLFLFLLCGKKQTHPINIYLPRARAILAQCFEHGHWRFGLSGTHEETEREREIREEEKGEKVG